MPVTIRREGITGSRFADHTLPPYVEQDEACVTLIHVFILYSLLCRSGWKYNPAVSRLSVVARTRDYAVPMLSLFHQ